MGNVVSYSFFRSEHSGYESANAGVARGIFFINFVRALVRAHHVVWRDWELRVHHDDRVMEFPYFRALERMAGAGLMKLVYCGKAETLCGSMLWRLRPLWDPSVNWLAMRDVDSLPMPRDRVMVEEAMASEATAHAILDSESHSGPFMGGMTSFCAPAVRQVECYQDQFEDFAATLDLNRHGADQRALNTRFWPKLKEGTLIHQRRQDIQYPDALETRPVAPKEHPLDKIVHCGAAYDVERAMVILASCDYPEKAKIEECERT